MARPAWSWRWWGYPVLSLIACLLPAAVGVAAYAAARLRNPVAVDAPEV